MGRGVSGRIAFAICCFFLFALAFGGGGGIAYAHTSLSGSSPADGETLETPPEQVPEPEPEPEPVVEEPAEVEPEPESAAPAEEVGHEHTGHEPTEAPEPAEAGGSSAFAALLYASRIAYYASLLPLLGWALWSALRPQAGERLAYWRRVGLLLQAVHLAVFIAHVAIQWAELSGDNPSASFLDALRDTGTGQSWLFTGLLSLAGFPLLFRSRAADAVWAALVIAAKTFRGHASAFEPVALTRLMDAVHLGAASLWIGGLLALALLLRKFRDEFRAFAPSFSTAALASYAVLVGTGIAAALLYTESLADIVRTTWGRLLLAKAALALAVLPVAALLRRRLLGAAERPDSFRAWLRADVALLAAIIALTGVLTHMSPVVERVPFHWHVMGTTAHLTADIADVSAGDNSLALKVWVPEGEGAPAVTAVVAVPGEPDRPAALRAVALPSEEWEEFSGFEKYTFVGDIEILDPDAAELRVRIQRSGGAETLDYAKKLIDP